MNTTIPLLATDLRDTRGAALFLAERVRRRRPESTRVAFAVDTIHLLVKSGRLRAYVFGEDGVLTIRDATQRRRAGQALFFAVADLEAVALPQERPGKPRKA